MTKKELSQLYYLNREVTMWQKELNRLQSRSIVGSPPLDGSGGGSDVSDKTANLAVDLADITCIIGGKLTEIQYLIAKLTKFINEISDSQTRQIFTYRCINGLTWNEIADIIGGFNTEDSVRKVFSRYCKKHGIF